MFVRVHVCWSEGVCGVKSRELFDASCEMQTRIFVSDCRSTTPNRITCDNTRRGTDVFERYAYYHVIGLLVYHELAIYFHSSPVAFACLRFAELSTAKIGTYILLL